jgi:hypothetical protein
MIILTEQLSYNATSNTFSAYASDLNLKGIEKNYVIYNPNTKISQYFKFTHNDKDGSDEDTYGWNYESHQGTKLLIIND